MTPIQLLQHQFDKIYVLSIPSLTERHALLQQALQGLEYQLFFGIDKSTIDLQREADKGWYNNAAYHKYNKDGATMRLGVYCCSVGHKLIYEDIVKHNYKSALILEDDVVLCTNELALLPQVFNQLPADWELLYLGYEKNDEYGIKQRLKSLWYQLFPKHALLKMKSSQFKKYYAQPLTENIWHAGFHDCTHAYAITHAAAQKMIALQTPIQFKSDTLLAYGVTLNMLNAYIAKPKLFDQMSIHAGSAVQSLVTEH